MAKNSKKFHAKATEALECPDPMLFNTAECVTIKLFGYRKKGTGPFTFTTVQEVDQIAWILVEEVSGDEITTIKYKDGEYEKHDPSNCRCMNFFEGSYMLDTEEEIHSFIAERLVK